MENESALIEISAAAHFIYRLRNHLTQLEMRDSDFTAVFVSRYSRWAEFSTWRFNYLFWNPL